MPEASKSVLVVINTIAGNGLASKLYSQFYKFLKDHGLDFFPYHTTGHNDIANLKKLVQHRKFEVISILGGDGTINAVVNAIGDEDIRLHLVPCGTGNDLLGNLSKKQSMREYFEYILKDSFREIDVFRCNDRRFVGCFGIGFDGRVSEIMEHTRNRNIPKALSYWNAILSSLFSYKEIELEINKEKKEVFLFSLSNNDRFGGGFLIAPGADLNDELLDMVLIGKTTLMERIQNLLKLKNGKHLNLDMVEHKHLKECRIYAKNDLPAHVDGELLYDHNYIIQHDRKLKIII